MNFTTLKNLTIPEGEVTYISNGREILWKKYKYKKKLSYLESTGEQYINTGIIGKSGIKTFLDLEFMSDSFDDFIISGSCSGSGATKWNVRIYPVAVRDGEWMIGYGEKIYSGITPEIGHRYAVESELLIGKQTMIIDGLTVINDTLTNEIDNNLNMYLFGVNHNNTFNQYEGSRIYSCSIEVDGVLVRDFIPVLDWNNVPCMYDKVSEELFYNKGTGTFKYS